MNPQIAKGLRALNRAFPELQPKRRRQPRTRTINGIRYRVRGQMLVPVNPQPKSQ